MLSAYPDEFQLKPSGLAVAKAVVIVWPEAQDASIDLDGFQLPVMQ